MVNMIGAYIVVVCGCVRVCACVCVCVCVLGNEPIVCFYLLFQPFMVIVSKFSSFCMHTHTPHHHCNNHKYKQTMECSICYGPHCATRSLKTFKCASCLENGIQWDKLACRACHRKYTSDICPFCRTTFTDTTNEHVIQTRVGKQLDKMQQSSSLLLKYVIVKKKNLFCSCNGCSSVSHDTILCMLIMGIVGMFIGYMSCNSMCYGMCEILGGILACACMIGSISFCNVTLLSICCKYIPAMLFAMLMSVYIILSFSSGLSCNVNLIYFVGMVVCGPVLFYCNRYVTLQYILDRLNK